jgi:hypothetical protein
VLGELGMAFGVKMLLLLLLMLMPCSQLLMGGMENRYVPLRARKAASQLLVASVVNQVIFLVRREQMIGIDLYWLRSLLLSS